MALTHNSMDKLRTLVQNHKTAQQHYNDAVMKKDYRTAEQVYDEMNKQEQELAWLQYENNVKDTDLENFAFGL